MRVILDLDVGDQPYADAITYFIDQYGDDGGRFGAEVPDLEDICDAVEHVIGDHIDEGLLHVDPLDLDHWSIVAIHTDILREGTTHDRPQP